MKRSNLIWLLTFVLTGTFYTHSLMELLSAGSEVDEVAGITKTHPDLVPLPSDAYLMDFIASLTDRGRMLYSLQLTQEDFIYPISYLLFFGALLLFFSGKAYPGRVLPRMTVFLFVLGMVFDWMENLVMVGLLDAFPKEIYDYYTLYRICSGIKWLGVGLGMLCLGYFFLRWVIKIRQVNRTAAT